MRIVQSSVEFITELNRDEILKNIEKIGRTCYKSEDLITTESAPKFVSMLVARGHEAMIEHVNVSVKFTTNRGVSHELVRHRIASYAQESSRYCNYSKDKYDNQLTFINISEAFPNCTSEEYEVWLNSMARAERDYLELIELGSKPDFARDVLPNSLKTEIVATMNLREWRHFIRLRTSKFAHPEIRIPAIKVFDKLNETLPEIFSDLESEVYRA